MASNIVAFHSTTHGAPSAFVRWLAAGHVTTLTFAAGLAASAAQSHLQTFMAGVARLFAYSS